MWIAFPRYNVITDAVLNLLDKTAKTLCLGYHIEPIGSLPYTLYKYQLMQASLFLPRCVLTRPNEIIKAFNIELQTIFRFLK